MSVDPQARTAAVDADLRDALKVALDGGEPSGVEPVDWLTTTSPRHWRVGQSTRTYDWLEPTAVLPVAD